MASWYISQNNSKNKQWRRSFDLAHELFHILTWKVFRTQCDEKFVPNKNEERLANAFASRLLMPADSIKNKVEANLNDQRQITFDKLEDIARQFDVSLEALTYRIASIYHFKKDSTKKYIDAIQKYMRSIESRISRESDPLPERYCELAQRALREAKISLIQFAKYMGIGYKEAQQYIMDEQEITDEKIEVYTP